MATHALVDAWLREGRPMPTPADVELHLAHCTPCARSVRDLDRMRGWFPDPGEFMSAEAVCAIRFHLQATARQVPRRFAPLERRGARRKWLPALRIAAALLMLAACAGSLVWWPWRGAENPEPPPSFAQVESLGAEVRHAVNGAEESFIMEHGSARFRVTPLPPGRSVVVQVGLDRVVVHGTRFRVDARFGRLTAVTVDEGVVALELFGYEPIRLVAGGSWSAQASAAHATSAAADPAPVTSNRERSNAAASPERVNRKSRRRGGVASTPDPQPSRRADAHASAVADSQRGQGSAAVDAAFGAAWALQRAGRYEDASLAFDDLLTKELGARRVDVLFWAAQAHQFSGRRQRAEDLYRELVRRYPTAWRTGDARQQLEQLNGGEKRSGSATSGQNR